MPAPRLGGCWLLGPTGAVLGKFNIPVSGAVQDLGRWCRSSGRTSGELQGDLATRSSCRRCGMSPTGGPSSSRLPIWYPIKGRCPSGKLRHVRIGNGALQDDPDFGGAGPFWRAENLAQFPCGNAGGSRPTNSTASCGAALAIGPGVCSGPIQTTSMPEPLRARAIASTLQLRPSRAGIANSHKLAPARILSA